MKAELLTPPARELPAPLSAALQTARAAFFGLNRSTDLGADTVALCHPLLDMKTRFEWAGYPVQAAHVAAALAVLTEPDLSKPGEWDEETLERERWRRIDAATTHLDDATAAHTWRSVMTVDVREASDRRVDFAA